MKRTHKQNGITLVALIVTIIVLLILAGISIQALTNQGLSGQAENARKETKRAQVTEWLNLKLIEEQMNNPTGTAEQIIEAIRLSSKGNKELTQMGKSVIVDEETSTVENGQIVDIYFYVQVDEDVYKVEMAGAKFMGGKEKFPPVMIVENVTNTTNSITMKIKTSRNEEGKIDFYIKKEGETEYTNPKYTTKGEEAKGLEYTFTGLEQNKKYNIKIVATAKNGQTKEILLDRVLGSVTISKGNITSSVISWNGPTATVKFETTTGYYIQTKAGDGNWSANPSVTGLATTIATSGTVVYARLTDSTGQYNDGDTVAITPVLTYSIAYNGNGATSGSMSNSSHKYGIAKNLTANGFEKTSYKFTGWNTKADGSGTSYSDGQSITNLSNENGATITLYAQWVILHTHTDSCYAHKHIDTCYTVHTHTGSSSSGGGCYGEAVKAIKKTYCSGCKNFTSECGSISFTEISRWTRSSCWGCGNGSSTWVQMRCDGCGYVCYVEYHCINGGCVRYDWGGSDLTVGKRSVWDGKVRYCIYRFRVSKDRNWLSWS